MSSAGNDKRPMLRFTCVTTTRLNPYAGFWTDYVMSEIQRRILTVIQRRCETAVNQAMLP
jgi:hypothetical protein